MIAEVFHQILAKPLSSPFGSVLLALAAAGLVLIVIILIGLVVVGLFTIKIAVISLRKTGPTRALQLIAATRRPNAGSDTPENVLGQNGEGRG